mmetsp:Transcript_27000/g.78603  ORF Transcript_27000/g.78603 Transcript_27000/m.78603 type:complete len:331 (-) Transcript_27000:299-1291(-)
MVRRGIKAKSGLLSVTPLRLIFVVLAGLVLAVVMVMSGPGGPLSLDPLPWGLRGSSGDASGTLEAVYQDWLTKARTTLKTRNDGTRNIWDLFEGVWRCSIEQRIGKIGDGGKWVCNPQDLAWNALQRQCIVYSFGSAGEVSFEQEVIDKYQCDVHTFDPTLDTSMKIHMRNIPGLHFHPVGIEEHKGDPGPVSSSGERGMQRRGFRSLRQVMATLKHEWVDVLKVDIEGNEWDLFNNDLLCSQSLPASQVLVELHYREEGDLYSFMWGMYAHGFRIFRREANVLDVQHCWEYAFVRTSGPSSRELRNFLAACHAGPQQRNSQAALWFKGR